VDPSHLDTSIPFGHEAAWTFGATSSGTTTVGADAPAILDGSHDLTIAVWVKPDPSSSGERVVMTQDAGGGTSQFKLLEDANNRFEFCILVPSGADPPCAISNNSYPSAPVDGGGPWSLLIGRWLSSTKAMEIQVRRYGTDGRWMQNLPLDVSSPVSRTLVPVASSRAVVVGRDQTADGHHWSGAIADPLIYDNYLAGSQLKAVTTARQEF